MDEKNNSEKVESDSEFTPYPEGEEGSKTPIVAILVVIFLLLISGIAFFLFRYETRKQTGSYPAPGSKVVSKVSQESTKDWKTYQNQDFSIQYPPDTKMRYFDKYNNFGFSGIQGFQIVQLPEKQENPAYFSLSISIVKDSQKQKAIDIARRDINALSRQDPSLTQANLVSYQNNKIKGYAFTIPKKNQDGSVVTVGEHIIVVHDSSVLLIEIKGNPGGLTEESLEKAESILSTFSEVLPHPRNPVIKDQITYSLPANWKESVSSDVITLTSADWNENDPENLFASKNGLKVTITRQPGGTFTSQSELFTRYKSQSSDQEHGAKEVKIGGYSGFSTLYTAEAYLRRYRIWQGDTLWTFIVSGSDKNAETGLTSLLSSIRFTGK